MKRAALNRETEPPKFQSLAQERAWLLKQAVKEALDERDDQQREIMKEAINEWLNARFTEFGKWTFRGLIALAVAGIAYITAVRYGIHIRL